MSNLTTIFSIPAFKHNNIWCVHGGTTDAAVDLADATPVPVQLEFERIEAAVMPIGRDHAHLVPEAPAEEV
jgi:hypothetical protein